MPGSGNGWVDAHAHFIPECYRLAWSQAPNRFQDGMRGLPPWSISRLRDSCGLLGVSGAVVGVPSPGVWFGDDAAAARLAREVNEFGAALARDVAGLGFYGCLPLPAVDAGLAEIAYCHDELRADGFIVFSNADGGYPGDPRFAPVWAELDRLGATVLLHPCSPAGALDAGIPGPVVEFPLDTTRAVTSMLVHGTLARHRRMRVIVPHAGAAIPLLADRVAALAPQLVEGFQAGAHDELAALYYDLSGPVLPRQLPALLAMTDAERLLYATDAPFMPPDGVARWRQALADTPLLDDTQRAAVTSGTARSLFPRLGVQLGRST